jgi:hypothetical protein
MEPPDAATGFIALTAMLVKARKSSRETLGYSTNYRKPTVETTALTAIPSPRPLKS